MTGLFLSDDPLPMDDGDGFNRYSYANDNPYAYSDPSGFEAEPVNPPLPPVPLPGVRVTATYTNPPSVAPFGGFGDPAPIPSAPEKTPDKVCTGSVDVTPISADQANSNSAIYGKPVGSGTIAISPAHFGLVYPEGNSKAAIRSRAKTQAWLRANLGGMTVEIFGFDAGKDGPAGTIFTVGDVGDKNIRTSKKVRLDVYRWSNQKAALAWGRHNGMTAKFMNMPAQMKCPY